MKNLRADISHEGGAIAFYRKIAEQATEEGFEKIAASFQKIGNMEETHWTKF